MFKEEIKDTPNERMVYFSDGGHAKLVRENPYGLWYVKWHAGAVPEKLSGSYTDQDKARIAIEQYVNSKDYNGYAKVVPEKVEIAPPIEIKKRFRKEEATA